MPPSPRDYLDPDVLARIAPLGLRANVVMEGSISGQHRSPLHGVSPEFADHREYTPGDDLKNLDWRVFARSDRFYIKRFEEESNLRCTIVLDASPSMAYAGEKSGRSKFDCAATTAACLAAVLMRQRDAVGLATLDNELRALLPAKATQRHFNQLLESIHQANPPEPGKGPDAETELGPVLSVVADRVHRRGMVILISDLLADLDLLWEGLGKLQHGNHELLVLQVLDGDEIDLPFNNSVIFKDIEGGGSAEQVYGEPWAFRKAYREEMQRFINEVKSRCQFAGVDHVLLRTDEDLGLALSHYLHARQRRGPIAKHGSITANPSTGDE